MQAYQTYLANLQANSTQLQLNINNLINNYNTHQGWLATIHAQDPNSENVALQAQRTQHVNALNEVVAVLSEFSFFFLAWLELAAPVCSTCIFRGA